MWTTKRGYTICAGDYSHWFREAIKDSELADEAAAVERANDLTPAETRQRINSLVAAQLYAAGFAGDANFGAHGVFHGAWQTRGAIAYGYLPLPAHPLLFHDLTN